MSNNRTQPLDSVVSECDNAKLQVDGHENSAFDSKIEEPDESQSSVLSGDAILVKMNPQFVVNCMHPFIDVDADDYVPGISMPRPVENLSRGVPATVSIPTDKLASIENLKNLELPHNLTALDYLMSNDLNVGVHVTKYGKKYKLFDLAKFLKGAIISCGCNGPSTQVHDTSKSPEKLIAGNQKNHPLFDISSWETSENPKPNPIATTKKIEIHPDGRYVGQKFNNYFSFRQHGSGAENELFGYQSEFEPYHWYKPSTFECAEMNNPMVESTLIDSYREMWDEAHKISNASTIYKIEGIDKITIGKTLITPFEFIASPFDIRKTSDTKKWSIANIKWKTTTIDFFFDHAATFNMECRIFNSEHGESLDLNRIQYRIRAVTDYPTAVKNYSKIGIDAKNDKYKQSKANNIISFAIIDGNLTEPITAKSILGSAVMQSDSKIMAIKFPEEAGENDRIRLFTSLVMLENLMRTRSYRDEMRQKYVKTMNGNFVGYFRACLFIFAALVVLVPILAWIDDEKYL